MLTAFGSRDQKNDSHNRTITIDDDLLAMLLSERAKHLRIIAGIEANATVDLSLNQVAERRVDVSQSGFGTVIRSAKAPARNH